MPPKCRWVTR